MIMYHKGVFDTLTQDEFKSCVKIHFLRVGQALRKKGNQGSRGKRSKIRYRNIVCAFDIETTRIMAGEDEHSIMYMWQFCFDDTVYIGRTWEEYKLLTDTVTELCKENEYLVVYVHNLSYEFQFLSGLYEFSNEDVFCVDSRKILKATQGGIEYRCSYLHTNMSLDRWTYNLHVKHAKIHDFDYNVKRYPWTEIDRDDLQYGVNDVLGLVECIKVEMERDNDNLYTIPLTSTGYVRRNIRTAMSKLAPWLIRDRLKLTQDVYEMLIKAFRGGDTHANRYFVNRILENVKSYDRSSSYPDVLLNHQVPMTAFVKIEFITMDDIIKDIFEHGKCCLLDLAIENYAQEDRFNGFPYLPFSKCRKVINPCLDNGRILKADYLEVTVTDIDLRIILKEISKESVLAPLAYYKACYGDLPNEIKDEIRTYYKNKTELKGGTDDYFYMKSKNLLNSIYGLMVQNPCKQDILFNECSYDKDDKPIQTLLDAYNKTAFTSYAWGVWCTAWARYELRRALWQVGRFAVYCDTDSVKFLGDVDFSTLNSGYVENSTKNNAMATKGDKTYYMGVYEHDGTYKRFATLGAKKYCYEDKDGKLHITIAGVNKKEGAKELTENGGMERFLLDTYSPIGTNSVEIDTNGFIFRKAGGRELLYNDDKDYGYVEIEGRKLHVTRNVVIRDSTYQIGVSGDYKRLLENVEYKYVESD